jgi:metallo-beta-lactamase class B
MFVSLAVSAAVTASGPASVADWRTACAGKEGWSDPAPPLHVFANVYDVGTCGITVLLITSPRGHILLDGATADAAPSVAANIERLGFKLTDVKLIGASHEHYDHVGGIAELQRRTGATLMAMPSAYVQLQTGQLDKNDPQFGSIASFPAANVGIMLRDGFDVFQGGLRLTSWATPGHAPGGTSWTWRSCEDKSCVNFVYADSVSAVSADGYRFSDHKAYVRVFRDSLKFIGRMRCDLLITPHRAASNFIDRLEGKAPLIGRGQCAAYAANGRAALDARLAKEQSSPARGGGP